MSKKERRIAVLDLISKKFEDNPLEVIGDIVPKGIIDAHRKNTQKIADMAAEKGDAGFSSQNLDGYFIRDLCQDKGILKYFENKLGIVNDTLIPEAKVYIRLQVAAAFREYASTVQFAVIRKGILFEEETENCDDDGEVRKCENCPIKDSCDIKDLVDDDESEKDTENEDFEKGADPLVLLLSVLLGLR